VQQQQQQQKQQQQQDSQQRLQLSIDVKEVFAVAVVVVESIEILELLLPTANELRDTLIPVSTNCLCPLFVYVI